MEDLPGICVRLSFSIRTAPRFARAGLHSPDECRSFPGDRYPGRYVNVGNAAFGLFAFGCWFVAASDDSCGWRPAQPAKITDRKMPAAIRRRIFILNRRRSRHHLSSQRESTDNGPAPSTYSANPPAINMNRSRPWAKPEVGSWTQTEATTNSMA